MSCVPSVRGPVDVGFYATIPLGVILTYLPQQINLLYFKTSKGLSLWYPLMGTCGTACFFISKLLGNFKWIGCCGKDSVPPSSCYLGSMPIFQMALQYISLMLVFIFYIVFHPGRVADLKKPKASPGIVKFHKPRLMLAAKRRNYRMSVITMVFEVAAVTVLYGISGHVLAVEGMDSQVVKDFAQITGVTASVLMALQFLPQIVETVRLKGTYSLSKVSLLLQVPGVALLVYAVIVWEKKVAVEWVPYIAHSMLLLILLIVTCYYDRPWSEESRQNIRAGWGAVFGCLGQVGSELCSSCGSCCKNSDGGCRRPCPCCKEPPPEVPDPGPQRRPLVNSRAKRSRGGLQKKTKRTGRWGAIEEVYQIQGTQYGSQYG